jgi:hypothetical protein
MKPALVKFRYPYIPKAVDLHVCFQQERKKDHIIIYDLNIFIKNKYISDMK